MADHIATEDDDGEEKVHDHDFSPDNGEAIRGHLIEVHDLHNMKATRSELGTWDLELLHQRLHGDEEERPKHWEREKHTRKAEG